SDLSFPWANSPSVPTEEILSQMRTADPPVRYLVGTPKGRLSKLEKELLDKPWRQARLGVQVKLLPKDGELYVFAESRDRLAKERSMRRRQLKWLWKRLKELSAMTLSRQELLMKLGAARERPHRLAAHRHRRRRERPDLPLSPRSRQAASGAKARGPLSAAHQSRRRRSRQIVELLSPARPHRGGLPQPQGRSRRQADLPSAGRPCRSPHLHRLPGLLPARHARPTAGGFRPGADAAQRAREVLRRADDRRPHSNHRRARDPAYPPHRAASRTQASARQAQARIAAPAVPQNHLPSSRLGNPAVVPTFGTPPK